MLPYNYTLMMKMEASYPLDDLIPTGIRQNGKAAQQTTRDILLENIPKESWHQRMHYQTQVQLIIVMTQSFLSK